MAIILKVNPADDGIKLNVFTEKHFKYLTKSHFYKLVRTGQIRVNGKRVSGTEKLSVDDEVRFPPFIYEYKNKHDDVVVNKSKIVSKNVKKQADDLKNCIIYEDYDLIAFDKPNGIASQGGSGTYISMDNLVELIDDFDNESFNEDNLRNYRLVHRLDKETSGIMLFAKNLNSAKFLTNQFKEKVVKKTYLALCYGVPENKSGVISTDIIVDDRKLSAKTKYKIIASFDDKVSLLELSPETGRKHQIRIHLADIKNPVVGDTLHANRKMFKALQKELLEDDLQIDNRLYLHAYSIEFKNPSDNKMQKLYAKLSGNFKDALVALFDDKIVNKYVK